MGGESRDLRVQQRVQGGAGVVQVGRELAHYPGSCIQHLTNALLVSVASEQVSVLENGGLGGGGEEAGGFQCLSV